MTNAKVAQASPIAVEVEEGKSYFWCTCGLSSKQPFCDGSHKDTEFTPMKYDALESGKKYFCACKQTSGQPLCDGSHNNLD
jgi:CDGSH iron-sulfur domain-containing protein 3